MQFRKKLSTKQVQQEKKEVFNFVELVLRPQLAAKFAGMGGQAFDFVGWGYWY